MRAFWVWTRPPAAACSTRTTSCWSPWRRSATRSDPSAAARLRYRNAVRDEGLWERGGLYVACSDATSIITHFIDVCVCVRLPCLYVDALVHPSALGPVCRCFRGRSACQLPQTTKVHKEGRDERRRVISLPGYQPAF